MKIPKLLALLLLISLSTGCNLNQPEIDLTETNASIDLVEDLGLNEEPVKLSDDVYYLGAGIPPEDLKIVKPTSSVAAQTIKTDRIWLTSPLNLSGQGFVVGVWEASGKGKHKWAVSKEHEKLKGRVTVSQEGVSSDHATAVAGIIAATGNPSEFSTGMTQGVEIESYSAQNDFKSLKKAANSIVASNHSYGLGVGWQLVDVTSLPEGVVNFPKLKGQFPVFIGSHNWFGNYELAGSEKIDKILQDYPYLISVFSSGNDRDDNMSNLDVYQTGWYVAYVEKSKYLQQLWGTSGFDFQEGFYLFSKYYSQSTPPPGDGEYFGGYRTIVPQAATKNGIVVGAVDGEKNMTDFSGWGPTETGQIKPDVVGNGYRLPRLLSASGGYLKAYKGSGTSYSAPSVTGTAVLLVEHFQNLWQESESVIKETTNSEKPFSATIKGLLIHTAEDLGNEGPDYQFGWGLVDAKAAADFLTKANKSKSDKFLLEKVYPQRQPIQVISDGRKPLKVTIAWTDQPGKNIVNDLDLRVREVTGNGYETYYPWSLNPNKPDLNAVTNRPNKFDNVEQVLIKETKKDAKYVILVDGEIDDSRDSQYYSLLIEGAKKPPSVGKVSCSMPYRPEESENTRKITSASIKSTAEGYSLIMIEEDGKEQVINFDKNLHPQSAGTVADKDYDGVYKAGDLIPWNLIANSVHPHIALKIQSNGSFKIGMWVSTRSTCLFEGTAQFVDGAKNEIFGLNQN
ncbi:S8 family serine peptidase [Okeania sp.]|uniref:S8 family serine peptidase n=1 Tax=Okeania sp. TaxID=3100323 RepID=UPI002B4B6785|nr:S8 family serine peptidase [Okeania sp.]MEB3340927.1 S8 family serine peptidase [Okeania sp.]